MKNLLNQNGVQIAIDKNEPRISHKVIAEALDINTRSIYRQVLKHEAELNQLGIVRFENALIKGRGMPERIAMLNEDQSLFILTMSRNTDKAIQAKLRLVKAFKSAREAIAIRETEYNLCATLAMLKPR